MPAAPARVVLIGGLGSEFTGGETKFEIEAKTLYDVITALEENQFGDIVFLCKAAFARSMFENPALQVVGDACIENSVVGVGHDVNAVLFFGHDSPFDYVIASGGRAPSSQ